jgi:hypothetical protein
MGEWTHGEMKDAGDEGTEELECQTGMGLWLEVWLKQ